MRSSCNIYWRTAIWTASKGEYTILNTCSDGAIGGSQQTKTFSEVLGAEKSPVMDENFKQIQFLLTFVYDLS